MTFRYQVSGAEALQSSQLQRFEVMEMRLSPVPTEVMIPAMPGTSSKSSRYLVLR